MPLLLWLMTLHELLQGAAQCWARPQQQSPHHRLVLLLQQHVLLLRLHVLAAAHGAHGLHSVQLLLLHVQHCRLAL
jgi:hypothetical protein